MIGRVFGRQTMAAMPLVVGAVVAASLWLSPSADGTDITVAPDAVRAGAERADPAALAEAVAARPLFDTTRRALPSSDAPQTGDPAGPVSPARPSLAGIVSDAEGPIALMRLGGGADMRRVLPGDRLADWQVVAIHATSVTLRDASGAAHILPIGRSSPD